jgi:hypothetical protein
LVLLVFFGPRYYYHVLTFTLYLDSTSSNNMSIPAGLDLSKVPLTRPPPGHVSNFVNPKDSLADVIFGVSTSMTIVTAFVVIARLIANMKQSRKWFFDDCKSLS